jgi:hypothetical protein
MVSVRSGRSRPAKMRFVGRELRVVRKGAETLSVIGCSGPYPSSDRRSLRSLGE